MQRISTDLDDAMNLIKEELVADMIRLLALNNDDKSDTSESSV